MIQHKTWFKILLNPLFRLFGFSIISKVKNDKVIGYMIRRYPKYCKIIK